MRIVVTFDTPYDGWDHPDHERQMATEVAAWKHDEPEMEYQIADALRVRGHEVILVGVRNDLQYLVRCLDEIRPDLVFNGGRGVPRQRRPRVHGPRHARGRGVPLHRLAAARPAGLPQQGDEQEGPRLPRDPGARLRDLPPGRGASRARRTLRFPLIVKPLQSDASAGIAQASVVQDAAVARRAGRHDPRAVRPAGDRRGVRGRARALREPASATATTLDILPITEMVFDKRRTRPEERIATQFAKWDEDYRARKGIRNVFARPLARAARERIEEICRTAFRALWLRDYARLDVRLAPDGEVWVLEANANPFISYGHDMANAAEKAGMDYYEFIQRLVDEAMARYEHA